jgi:Synergist-CTERM protein sorting domain-containing protein
MRARFSKMVKLWYLEFLRAVNKFQKGSMFMRKFTGVLLVLLFTILVCGTAAFAIDDRLTRRIDARVDAISEDIIQGIMGGLRIESVSFPDYPEELTINPLTGNSYTSADFPGDGIVNMLQFCLGLTSGDQNNVWRVRVLHDNTLNADVIKGSPFVSRDYSNPANAGYRPKIGWIEYGPESASEMVMSLGHIDTVGQGNPDGWASSDLWLNPVRSGDGRIYARGTNDDKGPTVASIYALKVLRDLGVSVDRRIRVTFGTDEERPYWYGINYYKRRGGETPVYGISPDGGITLHEKGIMNAWPTVTFNEANPNIYVVSIDSVGVAYNAITDTAIALVRVGTSSRDAVMSNLKVSIDAYPMLKGDAQVNVSVESADAGTNQFIRVTSRALPGHGMSPTGINAYTRLMKVLTLFKCGADFETVAANTLKALSADQYMTITAGARSRDHETGGQTLGIYYVASIFGANSDTTVNVGLANWRRDATGKTRASFTFNIRFAQHPTSGDTGAGSWMMDQLTKALSGDAVVSYAPIATVTEGPTRGFTPNNMLAFPPMKLDPVGWRVESIRRVGRMLNGEEPTVGANSGGGTYAKAFINRLFGMGTFAASGNGHGYNEYLTVSSIWPATKLMASAFVEMAARDNFVWDVVGGRTDPNTKRNTNLFDNLVSTTSFDAVIAEIGAASGIASLDIKTVRNLLITSFDAGVTRVSFRVDTTNNPRNYVLFAKDKTTGAWIGFPFAASTRNVGDIDSAGLPITLPKACIIASVDIGGRTDTTTSTDAYGAQYAIASSTNQIYFATTGVSMDTAPFTLNVGQTKTLAAAVTPTNATNKGLVWTSSNSAVATVSNTGVVTAVSAGSATITASSDVDPIYAAKSTVTIVVPVTGVTVSPTSDTVVIGNTCTLTATVAPSNATNPSVTWSSDAPAVATVSATGVVTAVSAGTAKITVTTVEGGFSGICNITVPKLPPLVVTPTYPSDKGTVASDSGIASTDLEEKDSKVYLKKSVAEAVAKDLLGVKKVNTNILPVFEATVTPNGRIAEITFTVTGKELYALNPHDISVIGMISGSNGDFFDYVSNPADFDDGTFTLRQGGTVFSGEINKAATYELVIFVMDGGMFDLDGFVNGKVIASVFIASERKGGGGGCSVGYIAFALLMLIPFVVRRRRE